MRLTPIGLFALASAFVEPTKHDIIQLHKKNFEGTFQQYRDRFPGVILYFNENDDKHAASVKSYINDKYNPLASSLKGIARVGSVNCAIAADLCKAHNVDLSDAANGFKVQIFPPMPMPAQPWTDEGDMLKLKKRLTKFLPAGPITSVATEADAFAFVKRSATVPKLFIFSDKAKAAPLFQALSHNLGENIDFAYVKIGPDFEENVKLAKTFGVKNSGMAGKAAFKPSIFIKTKDQTLTNTNVQKYVGEMNYTDLHAWLNVFSETFVKGGGFVEGEAGPDLTKTRPWLFEEVPQLYSKSANDVCLKTSEGMCAILLKKSDEITPSEIDMMKKVKLAVKKPVLNISWLNLAEHPAFAQLFDTTEDGFVVLNPHKRMRFTKLSEDKTVSYDSIRGLMESIMNGDGRFKTIKGNKLPNFGVPEDKEEL